MTSRLKWYYSRLKTMSIGEWFFRAQQAGQRATERTFPVTPVMPKVYTNKTKASFSFDHRQIPSDRFFIFGEELKVTGSLDFHLDISSGKRFPLDFSKTIDMRTDRFGSAKVVWEVNRLQFLLPILIRYRISGETKELDLFVEILRQWDKQNPYMKGINWYSNIEVNIRLINWYWCWVILENDERWMQDVKYEAFRNDTWLPLIYKHCRYSSKNPSYYSSANNHLVSEYTGLFMASCLWQFPESKKWLKKTKAGLEKEIILQHSENGINREEAAAYIQFITDFFIGSYISAQHHGIRFSNAYEQRLKAICNYIHNFLDIRNNIPAYGDDDHGRVIIPGADANANNFTSILQTAAVLFNEPKLKSPGQEWDIKSSLLTAHLDGKKKWEQMQAAAEKKQSVFYKNEGHFILKKGNGNGKEIYCHFDAAPLGYLSIAAHGHADALSIILHIDGYPFLVDPGTYAYHTHEEWRKYFVSTLTHNTITIDKSNQALMAGPTLWLNHFECKVNKVVQGEREEIVSASHNGYRDKGVIHTRTVSFDKDSNTISLSDELTTSKGGRLVSMPFHVHPKITIRQKGANQYCLAHPDTNSMVEIHFDPTLAMEKIDAADDTPLGWYSSSFMQKEKSALLLGEKTLEDKHLNLQTLIKITDQP